MALALSCRRRFLNTSPPTPNRWWRCWMIVESSTPRGDAANGSANAILLWSTLVERGIRWIFLTHHRGAGKANNRNNDETNLPAGGGASEMKTNDQHLISWCNERQISPWWPDYHGCCGLRSVMGFVILMQSTAGWWACLRLRWW